MTTSLAFQGIRALGEALRAGEVTSEELTLLYLDRLETLGCELGAVISVNRDLALEQARRADAELREGSERGALHGIPYGVKDVLATRGLPTTWGAQPFRDRTFDYDAVVVERLREAGAVLLAKLSMIELAGALGYTGTAASFTGSCLNPWNRRHWSGGSSGGSAVAVAAGLVGFAIGSESWGSMLGPSAFCGVTALRPTYGLVPHHGSMTYAWSLDKLGPMARSAEDCALVLPVLAGADGRETPRGSSLEQPSGGTDARRCSIGVPEDATAQVEPAVAAAFERSIEVLRSFASVETVSLPDYPWIPIIATIVDVEGALAFRDLLESGQARSLSSSGARIGGYAGLLVPGSQYLDAQRARRRVCIEMTRLLSGFDAIAAPTTQGVADRLEEDDTEEGADVEAAPAAEGATAVTVRGDPVPSALIVAGNLAGLPALALPNGFGRGGLPTSLQLVARAHGEAVLLSIATRFQRATGWHRAAPDVG